MPRASSYEYVPSPHDDTADQEILIYHLLKRERAAVEDRLTPRMEAAQILKALDESRQMRRRT